MELCFDLEQLCEFHHRSIDVLIRVEFTEGETYGSTFGFRVKRAEDVRSTYGAGGAGAATGCGDALEVQVEEEHAVVVGLREAYTEYGVETLVEVAAISVEGYTGYVLAELIDHACLESLDVADMVVHIAIGDLEGFGEADDTIGMLGAAAHVALLGATMYKRLELFVFANEHEADAFGSMELVGGGGDAMHIELRQVVLIVTYGLHGVGMKVCAVCMAEVADALQIEQVADLVVSVHQRHKRIGMFLEQGLKVVHVYMAVFIEVYHVEVQAAVSKLLEGLLDGVVLDGRGDGMLDAISVYRGGQDGVVGLGASGGEDDLAGCAVQQLGDLLAGGLYSSPHFSSVCMRGRRVTEVFQHKGLHGVKHFQVQWSGCGVVKIDHFMLMWSRSQDRQSF